MKVSKTNYMYSICQIVPMTHLPLRVDFFLLAKNGQTCTGHVDGHTKYQGYGRYTPQNGAAQ